MPFCSNCGNPLDQSSNFCKHCGASVAEPIVNAPVIVEPAPQSNTVPVSSAKSKVLGFVGMGLAISGLTFAILGMLYTFLGTITDGALGFGMAFAFSLFSLPLSIIGGVLCDRSSDMGNRSAACSVGSKMRVAGIIVSAVMLFIGIISLAA